MVVFIRSLSQFGVPANDAVFATTLSSLSGFASFLFVLRSFDGFAVPDWSPQHIGDRRDVGAGHPVRAGGWRGGHPAALEAASVLDPAIHAWMGHSVSDTGTRSPYQVRDLRRPFLYSLGVDLCGAAMLYAALLVCWRADGDSGGLRGYQVEMLFNVITPLFQGIGIADLSITVALNELGVAPLGSRGCHARLPSVGSLGTAAAGAIIYLFRRDAEQAGPDHLAKIMRRWGRAPAASSAPGSWLADGAGGFR